MKKTIKSNLQPTEQTRTNRSSLLQDNANMYTFSLLFFHFLFGLPLLLLLASFSVFLFSFLSPFLDCLFLHFHTCFFLFSWFATFSFLACFFLSFLVLTLSPVCVVYLLYSRIIVVFIIFVVDISCNSTT